MWCIADLFIFNETFDRQLRKLHFFFPPYFMLGIEWKLIQWFPIFIFFFLPMHKRFNFFPVDSILQVFSSMNAFNYIWNCISFMLKTLYFSCCQISLSDGFYIHIMVWAFKERHNKHLEFKSVRSNRRLNKYIYFGYFSFNVRGWF